MKTICCRVKPYRLARTGQSLPSSSKVCGGAIGTTNRARDEALRRLDEALIQTKDSHDTEATEPESCGNTRTVS